MTKAQKLASYAKQILARLEGDDSKVTAERNARMADAAYKGQLAALDGSLIEAETQLEEAQDRLYEAIYPISSISDRGYYIQNCLNAKEAVEQAEEEIEIIKDHIAFINEMSNAGFARKAE